MRRITALAPAILVIITALLALQVVPQVVRSISSAQTSAEIRLTRQALADDDILERLNAAVRNVSRSVAPSVVHIDVADAEQDQQTLSSGSGWVFDDSGHIVTNAHVVRGARRISVQFLDGRVETARKVGIDPFTDIAVLKVDRSDGLFAMRRGSVAPLVQGERVFAFGSPFGFKFSMSEGIVSGLGRTAHAGFQFGGYSNFIQTDAAVNPGNSGGPLVDIKGRLIGMNVAIATAKEAGGSFEGQSAGISFAIPLATIESVVEQLIATGSVRRGFMGIQYPQRNRPLALSQGGSFKGVGLPLEVVVEDGPAAKAGLKAGDVVTHLDNQPITGPDVLRSIIGTKKPGDLITVRAWYDSQFRDVVVTLGEMPRSTLLGLTVGSLRSQLGLALESPASVVAVFPEFPADRAGFEKGQTIVSINGAPVEDVAGFWTLLAENGLAEGKVVSIVVTSGEGPDAETKTLLLNLTR